MNFSLSNEENENNLFNEFFKKIMNFSLSNEVFNEVMKFFSLQWSFQWSFKVAQTVGITGSNEVNEVFY